MFFLRSTKKPIGIAGTQNGNNKKEAPIK
jgi:hypothetical protein